MHRGSFVLLCCLILLMTESGAFAQQKRPQGVKYRGCETLCADLNASIQKHPERLGMWLEDALVINEDCVGEIVTAAMDAVGNNAEAVKAIQETTLHVVPHRQREVLTALKRFKVPAAVAWQEPEEEVRRAVVPEPIKAPAGEVEIRRALAPGGALPTPIEEVRRAVVLAEPPKAKHTAPGKVAAKKRPRR
ncbi:MAG: hypothetical protein V4662_04845 [Verrucomicrobiota bacterium]